jgi:copper chaperone CopZ
MPMTKLKIAGMTCGHCVRTVKEALERVDGVAEARVDLDAGQATVDYDASRTTPRALATAVIDEGYMAEETG